jgi:tRNA G18 (ribose-2'-O)-methylase SpoU
VLRAHGFSLIALTPGAGAVPVDQLPLDELSLDGAGDPGFDRVALLFGAEGPGLSPETLASADVRAGIPMRGGVDSLNVGVAAGIAFWVLGRTGRHRARRPGADGERTSADT